MSWLLLLGIAVALTAFVGLTGAQPEGGRPVANTRMMGAARVILMLVAVALAIFVLWGGVTG